MSAIQFMKPPGERGSIVAMATNVAVEYGPSGIRCNAICPGFIDTPMLDAVLSAPEMAEVRRR